MEEIKSVHLDSRRLEEGRSPDDTFGDYCIYLDDTEAVESSPFRNALEALRDLGLTEINLGHPIDENFKDIEWKWWVYGIKKFPDTEKMVADNLGGDLEVMAEIDEDGERKLQFSFGAGDFEQFDTNDLNEKVWGYLEVIHKTLSNSWEGMRIPIGRTALESTQ
jgi:hypothetical protein